MMSEKLYPLLSIMCACSLTMIHASQSASTIDAPQDSRPTIAEGIFSPDDFPPLSSTTPPSYRTRRSTNKSHPTYLALLTPRTAYEPQTQPFKESFIVVKNPTENKVKVSEISTAEAKTEPFSLFGFLSALFFAQ